MKEAVIAFLEDNMSVWRFFALIFLAMGVTYLVLDIPGQAVILVFALVMDMMHDWQKQRGDYE